MTPPNYINLFNFMYYNANDKEYLQLYSQLTNEEKVLYDQFEESRPITGFKRHKY